MKVIGTKIVKTRKPHICFGCGREFAAGTMMEKSFVIDNVAWTCYICETCQNVIMEFEYYDEYGFGDLRDRALEIESQLN